jgi:hypothetical protein
MQIHSDPEKYPRETIAGPQEDPPAGVTRMNSPHLSEQQTIPRSIDAPDGLPDPVIASIFAVSGVCLGQFYNGHPARGLFWGGLGLALVLLLHHTIVIWPVGGIFMVLCAVDAHGTATKIQERRSAYNGIHALFWAEIIMVLSLATAVTLHSIVSVLAANGIPV